MNTPQFLRPKTSFHGELRKRINAYFEDKRSKSKGDYRLYLKAAILITAFIAVYTHLVFFPVIHWSLSILECLILGGLTAAIGFNVMHDGAHGSFSKKQWVNDLAGVTLNFLGANVFMWKTKHNVVHHSYTNIEGVDDDINARPFLRLCEAQKKYKIHQFQHLYFGFVYSLLYLYWVFFTDYKKYFIGRVGIVALKEMHWKDHFSFWGFKLFHLLAFIVIPIYFIGFLPWVIGFVIYASFAGFILSMVFQLAHTVADTHFPKVNVENNKIEDEWAIHQLKTTANFATNNRLVSWLVGGLNFQIEHHLFPTISHVHYPAISKIVKQVCEEYNIKYIEYPKVRLAVASHIAHLRNMGRA